MGPAIIVHLLLLLLPLTRALEGVEMPGGAYVRTYLNCDN